MSRKSFDGSAPAGRPSLTQLLCSIVAVATVVAAGAAHAQTSVGTRSENGLRVGSGRLHPLFGFETRYDSYVGRSEKAVDALDSKNGTGDLILHLRPGLELTIPSESVELGARLMIDYNAYTGAQESWTRDQSKTGVNFELNSLFNPKGNTKVGLDERFNRSDRTTNMELGTLTISDRNDLGVNVEVAPGGGALVIKPAYVNTYEHFEPKNGGADESVSNHDYMQHTVGLNLGYKLSPISALVLDTGLSIRNFEREVAQNYDSTNIRVAAGFVGMVMPKIALVLKAGYGKQSSDLEDGKPYGGMIGQAEVGYLYSEQSQIRFGYARTFEPSASASLYYSDDRVYLNGQTRMAGQLLLKGGLSYDVLKFPADARGNDEQLGFQIGPDWEFSQLVTAGVSYGYTSRTTSAKLAGLEYDRHEIGAHVVVYY
ncbi:outer membrane beta-barrel protein [Vulgatibacter incomptus]|uniref:Uncharacterized protein n=1 Tax=Vulgatibacter incomptus TaxID=1391653 RepID=A0A0K1PFB7_9BACT|nr:outer membrane beta-barrel protein [Vulgatibacter incomptus]AKU91809.1 hypothetical protein AKJ08_2196 [Vulgatibacter incomptus]